MGLDTTHDCWHGAYSSFTYWRNDLAERAGYTIGRDDHGIPSPDIDWGQVTGANLRGDWDETPADPLLVLIAHYDDDGHIHPTQAGPLADRLEELIRDKPDDGYGYVGDRTRQFIDGLRAAVEANEDVIFA